MDARTIYKSNHHENTLIFDHSIMKSVWHTKSDLTEETYRQEVSNYFLCVRQHQPKGILMDAINAFKIISVETQTWMVSTFFPIYKEIGCKKMAILLSKDIVTSMSIEQTLEEDMYALNTKYFRNELDALKWLRL